MPLAQLDSGSCSAIEPLSLDLRHLPAPEPMQRILDALPTLAAGQALIARTPCRPVPLIARLEAEGYRVAVAVSPTGDACIRIVPGDGFARA